MAAAKKKSDEPKFPKTPGEAIDILYNLRAERLELERQADTKKATETALTQYIMDMLRAAKLDGAKGSVATASIMKSTQAKITDIALFGAYCAKKKAWDLLRKQASIEALRARWDAGESVPGVEKEEVTKLSLTKAGAKGK